MIMLNADLRTTLKRTHMINFYCKLIDKNFLVIKDCNNKLDNLNQLAEGISFFDWRRFNRYLHDFGYYNGVANRLLKETQEYLTKLKELNN